MNEDNKTDTVDNKEDNNNKDDAKESTDKKVDEDATKSTEKKEHEGDAEKSEAKKEDDDKDDDDDVSSLSTYQLSNIVRTKSTKQSCLIKTNQTLDSTIQVNLQFQQDYTVIIVV